MTIILTLFYISRRQTTIYYIYLLYLLYIFVFHQFIGFYVELKGWYIYEMKYTATALGLSIHIGGIKICLSSLKKNNLRKLAHT